MHWTDSVFTWTLSCCTKNYQRWWKFDEVLNETISHSFFGTRCTNKGCKLMYLYMLLVTVPTFEYIHRHDAKWFALARAHEASKSSSASLAVFTKLSVDHISLLPPTLYNYISPCCYSYRFFLPDLRARNTSYKISWLSRLIPYNTIIITSLN